MVHKLGQGGYSTVWLAYDAVAARDVALKINVPGHAADREYETHLDMARLVADKSRLLLCHDSFLLPGYQGRVHRVLVLPAEGPYVRMHAVPKPTPKPRAARMSAARQLLQALDQMHSAGFVHRGKSGVLPRRALSHGCYCRHAQPFVLHELG